MKTEYFDLKNKRALVSGGASGIGSSIVEHLCGQGVEVYFFDIDKKEAKKTINKLLFSIISLHDVLLVMGI